MTPKNNCGQYVNLFISGYVKAKGIEAIAKIIVNLLNWIKTESAIKHKIDDIIKPVVTDIFPDRRKAYVIRTIAWLIKFGILEIN